MGATPDDAGLAGSRLGKSYRLGERLGEDPRGTLWRAVDTRTGEAVAARILPADAITDRAALRTSLRSGTPLRTLRDPHLVAVRDLVEERHRLALVTDSLDAGDLRAILRSEGPLPPGAAVALASGVLSGLAAMHGAGLAHGDVRPENVWLASYWRRLSPGSARLANPLIPGWGEPVAATTADDVRAAGALLFESLTGAPSRPDAPGPGPLDVPPRLWNALAALLAADPAIRPSAATGAATLGGLVDSLAGLRPLAPGPGQRPERPAASRVGAARYLPAGDLTGPAPRLGEPSGHTVVRPDAVPVPVVEAEPEPVATPWFRRGWVWPAIVGTVLVVVAMVWVFLGRPGL